MAGLRLHDEKRPPQFVVQTQMTLGNVITRPRLTAPLLLKPPFHFLHAILLEVVSSTGFGRGLYSAEELNSKLLLVRARRAGARADARMRRRPHRALRALTRGALLPLARVRRGVRPHRARSTAPCKCSLSRRCSRS